MGKEDQARPVRVDDEMAVEFAALGVEIARDEDDDGSVPVWSSNWETVRLFLELETQWRAISLQTSLLWLGLDYPAVDRLLARRFGSRRTDRGRALAAFEDLRLMEQTALDVFLEHAE